ncbi:MAG: PAS domain-containing sensor histidine kinase [Dehalococcoidia bacterium]|jgi:PAS domain S-box-containing protein
MAAEKKMAPEQKDAGTTSPGRSLRDEAEERLARSRKISPTLKGQTPDELIHELQVHQIELEMQAEELQRAHLALEESRDKYLDLYEFAPLGYLMLNDEAIIADVNLAGATLLGLPRSRLERARFRKFVAPQDSEAWDRYFMRVLQHEKKLTSTLMLTREDGTRFPARLESIRLTGKNEGKTTVRVAISDITDIRQAENALEETNEYLNNLLDFANAPIIVWDSSLRITRFNHAFEYLTGRVEQEVIGQPLEILVPALTRGSVLNQVHKTQSGEHWESVELPILHVDGSVRTVLWNSATLFGEDHTTVIATIAQGQDITDRKRVEVALRETNKKLNLLSSITRHDINNQLMAINGFLELLHGKVPDPALLSFFTGIMNASARITVMIQFTKEYEKIGVLAPVWQDISTLVDTAVKEAHLGSIGFANMLSFGTEVFADPLIAKVFYNLIDNAVRHGGKITFIRFTSKDQNGTRLIICEDDGDGVPAEVKERIFERGFGKNTGLGLFLAREILAITGITITENSVPGKGARFEIAVPKGMWRMMGAKE